MLRLRSLALYNFAAAYARERGIIIADTKFEFGSIDGELHVIDEILTPDSSRFWARRRTARAGRSRASTSSTCATGWRSSGWNKEPPAPELPPEVVEGTADRYREAYRRLTDREVE